MGDRVSVRWDETGVRFDATVEKIHLNVPWTFDVCFVEKVNGKLCFEKKVAMDRVLPMGSPSPATKRQRGAPKSYAEDDVVVIDDGGDGDGDGWGGKVEDAVDDDDEFDRVRRA